MRFENVYKRLLLEYVKRRQKYGLIRKSKDDPTYPTDSEGFYQKKQYKFDVSEYNKKRENELADSGEDILSIIAHMVKYFGLESFKFENFPKDGSLLYRGHKHIDPFSKSEDAKAQDESIYFSNNIDYVYRTYSTSSNKYSKQIGQALNNIQNKVKKDATLSVTNKYYVPFGYLTIGTPKNPNNIKWYKNFGHEYGEEPLNNSLPYDGETIVKKDDLSKIRTYLVIEYEEGHSRFYFVPLYIIKNKYPKFYHMLINE